MASRLYFVFCFLFAAASAVSAQTPTLDHFNCYFTQGPTLPQPVELLDQFDTAADPATGNVPLEHVTELTPFRFCNPVQKTTSSGVVTPVTHPDAHLVMYHITNQTTTLRAVTIQNQFTNGAATLITGPAVLLAVPSGKALLSSSAPPSLPPVSQVQGELDHFKCYHVFSGPNVGAVVTLVDQFTPVSANGGGAPALVLRPYLFCNPAVKVIPTTSTPNNPLAVTPPVTTPPTSPAGITITPILPNPPTPVNDPALHLTCYWIAARPQLQNISVFYDNQFTPIGTLPIAGSDLETLCVPSIKLAWTLLPSPTPTSPSVRLP